MLGPVVSEYANSVAAALQRAIAQPQAFPAAMGVRPNDADKSRIAIGHVSPASAAANCLHVIDDQMSSLVGKAEPPPRLPLYGELAEDIHFGLPLRVCCRSSSGCRGERQADDPE